MLAFVQAVLRSIAGDVIKEDETAAWTIQIAHESSLALAKKDKKSRNRNY